LKKNRKEKLTFSLDNELRERLEELLRGIRINNIDRGEKITSFSSLIETLLKETLDNKGGNLYEVYL